MQLARKVSIAARAVGSITAGIGGVLLLAVPAYGQVSNEVMAMGKPFKAHYHHVRGGPFGTVTTKTRGVEHPVDGLMVQLISHETGIRTTVYTNETGEFEFPALQGGDYVLRVPRPLRFERYEVDPVRIDGPTDLGKMEVVRVSDDEFLPPKKSVLDQLTGSEWLFNMAGTAHEKQLVVNMCGMSCHGSERLFQVTYDERSWFLILRRMTNYAHRTLQLSSGRWELNENAQTIHKFLTRVRGPDSVIPPIVPFPRPVGPATKAIVTEYELPWTTVNIHDVGGDADGNIWFNINRSPLVGKLDPATGEVTSYRVPKPHLPAGIEPFVDPWEEPVGMQPGFHGLWVDQKTGYVWFTGTWDRSINRLDPRTGEIKSVQTDLHANGNMALHPDGKSIWRTDQGKIKKYDTETVFKTGLPVQEWDLKTIRGSLYGNFISPDGKYFGAARRDIVWMDIETEEIREIPMEIGGSKGRGTFDYEGNMWSGSRRLSKYDPQTDTITQYDPPTPYFHAYGASVDKDGNVWSGEQSSGRVFRFNPKTYEWVEYVLPSPWSLDFNSWIDDTTTPSTYWYGDQHGYIVRIQPLE